MKVEKVADKYEEIKKLVGGKEVLDLGCLKHSIEQKEREGKEWVHGVIKEHAKFVLGVDIEKKGIGELKKRGYNVIYGKVDEISFDIGKKFDVVFAGELIEHLDNLGIFLKNVKKHLKNGGLLGITTCNPYFFLRFVEIILRDEIYCNPDHTLWLEPRTISQLFRKNKWEIKDIFWIRRPKWYRIGGLPMRFRKYFHRGFMVIAQPIA